MRAALIPLGALYGAAAALRIAAYDRGLLRVERLRGPVVSVGNLALGGRGKSPTVAWIARALQDAGRPVAILSRGYGGSYREQALLVSDGQQILAPAERAGDEPVMHARALPGVVIAVGRRRADAGRLVEERFGPRVHVLDDGFQHRALHRDLDLLCVGTGDLADWPIPAGNLRELARAAARADLALVEEGADPGSLAPARVVRVRRRVVEITDGAGRPAESPRAPLLLSGIARPERFRADALAWCGRVAGHVIRPDHHAFTPDDLAEVARAVKATGADGVLTTAKDAARLPASLDVRVLHIALEVEGDRLREALLAATESAA